MNGLLIATGSAVGAGVALVVRGLAPPPPRLADTIAALRQPGTRATVPGTTSPIAATTTGLDGKETDGWGWAARLGRPAAGWLARAGLPGGRTRADLELLGRPAAIHLAEQATTAIIGAVLPAAMTDILLLAGLANATAFTAGVPAWGCLVLAAAGFTVPTIAVRSQAAARRAEFTHALGSFLDLVVIGLAGGAGVDAALTQAAQIGHGWAFDRLRQTLQAAQITRVTPWTALGDLGDHLRVPALREIAAAVGLAGTEGARVRASLAAKASALRLRELTSAEAAAASATEQMSLPVIVMFAAFLIFIGFPAVTHVLGGL